MGILDWFKNRPAQREHDSLSNEMVLRAVDKAVTLTNPRLKLVRSYEERLAPAAKFSVCYLRDLAQAVPPAIRASAASWAFDPVLRAFFAAPTDIPSAIGRSRNLRVLFDKFPGLDEAFLILDMAYSEQRSFGMSMQGSVIQRDIAQTVVAFSDYQVRICGHEDAEVRRLLVTQAYEYLVAQAMTEIAEDRSERRELEDNRALIRARLRLLQQQGPGLGSVFGAAPSSSSEQLKLEEELTENERQLEMMGGTQALLEAELDSLCEVLEHPERYMSVEQKQLKISTMNVVLDDSSNDVSSDISFSLARLTGVPSACKAFVLARFERSEMPEIRMDFDSAVRFL
jgi:hypothetical protein